MGQFLINSIWITVWSGGELLVNHCIIIADESQNAKFNFSPEVQDQETQVTQAAAGVLDTKDTLRWSILNQLVRLEVH